MTFWYSYGTLTYNTEDTQRYYQYSSQSIVLCFDVYQLSSVTYELTWMVVTMMEAPSILGKGHGRQWNVRPMCALLVHVVLATHTLLGHHESIQRWLEVQARVAATRETISTHEEWPSQVFTAPYSLNMTTVRGKCIEAWVKSICCQYNEHGSWITFTDTCRWQGLSAKRQSSLVVYVLWMRGQNKSNIGQFRFLRNAEVTDNMNSYRVDHLARNLFAEEHSLTHTVFHERT